jgi:diacylglycerol O-acyltransferase-1
MASVEDLKAEKAKLEKRLSDIQVELSKHGEESSTSTTSKYSSTTGKASYLYKWQDRAIGWGGTKWGLRYVVLKGGVLSYFKDHDDAIRHAPRYKITLKNCAIRDDGYKENRHKKGSFFHVFSIYQRPKGKKTHFAEEDDADDIIPLLRFSTNNEAEKNQWMELLAEACAYCDSDEYVEEKEDTTLPMLLSGVQHKKGTLPPLIFAPVAPTSRLKRVNSSHVKLNKSKDAAKSNRGDYPPSKPMHRTVDPSYLSSEAHVQNYRGILNLFIIILIISNIRLLKETIRQYGFVISHGYFMKDGEDDFDWNDIDFPLILGLLILNVFVVLTYFIELSLAKKRLPEWFGMTLHFFNINLALGIPSYVVYNQLDSPINGAVLMLCATVLWMKLISFVHANSDYRHHPERNQDTNIGFVTSVDEDSLTQLYPQNVTLSNLYYFWFAPTLTYQIAFPRLAARNFPRIFSLALRLCICNLLAVFLIAQIIKPVLSDLINALEADSTLSVYSVHIFAEYILKLGMTSTYIWLLIFYGFFHVFLNLLAELLRFGDRV